MSPARPHAPRPVPLTAAAAAACSEPARAEMVNPLLDDAVLQTDITAGGSRSKALRRTHRSIHMDKVQLVRQEAFRIIGAVSERVGIPAVLAEHAKELFKQFQDKQPVLEKKAEVMAVACLYLSCREQKSAITFKELCGGSVGTSKKKIGRCVRQILAQIHVDVGIITPADCIRRTCQRLGLPFPMQQLAHGIAELAISSGVVRRYVCRSLLQLALCCRAAGPLLMRIGWCWVAGCAVPDGARCPLRRPSFSWPRTYRERR